MDLRIIPGKSGNFEFEDFQLKEIDTNDGKCEFYIHYSKLIKIFALTFLYIVFN
jgi:hypothetical protein